MLQVRCLRRDSEICRSHLPPTWRQASCLRGRRAFKQPQLYRGKILGSLLGALSVAAIGFFSYGLFYVVRQLPPASAAPRAGQKAPDFTLPDQNGKAVTLAALLGSEPNGAAGA